MIDDFAQAPFSLQKSPAAVGGDLDTDSPAVAYIRDPLQATLSFESVHQGSQGRALDCDLGCEFTRSLGSVPQEKQQSVLRETKTLDPADLFEGSADASDRSHRAGDAGIDAARLFIRVFGVA